MPDPAVSPKKNPLVAVFDSGAGGLTVLHALRQQMSYARFAYGFDDAFFPYGTKDEGEVVERAVTVAKQLVAQSQCDLLVVACHTISTCSLPRLRSELGIPVVGVVPAVKPAAQYSRTRRIGILASPGTVSRAYTADLITRFAPDCSVVTIGSAALVEQAERKLRRQPVDLPLLAAEVAPLAADAEIDTAVLACTHFGHLIPELEQSIDRPVAWICPSAALARRAYALLRDRYREGGRRWHPVAGFHTSASGPQEGQRLLWGEGFGLASFQPLTLVAQ